MKLVMKRGVGLAAALLVLGAASTSAAGDLIVDNDWSSDTFMPLLIALADNSSSLIGITSVSGNTWAGQCHAWSQRYLQLASQIYSSSSTSSNNTSSNTSSQTALNGTAANSSSSITTDPSRVGSYRGALDPLLRTDAEYQAGTGLTGTLAFSGIYQPYNQTAEAEGMDPTGNEENATRVTLTGYSAPQLPLSGALNQSAGVHAVNYLVQTAAEHRASNQSLSIAALGPLTNLALALKLDPDFPTGIDLIYSGGYLNFNVQLVSDAASSDFFNDLNTLIDPSAAAIVMRAPWKTLTLVGEASAVIVPSQQDLQSATSNLPNAKSSTASATSPAAYFAQRLLQPAEPGLPIWDEASLLALLRPELATSTVKGYVDIGVSPGTWNYGRTFAYPASQAPKYLREASIVTQLNTSAVIAAYVQAAQSFVRA